jgi:hypothetical protein
MMISQPAMICLNVTWERLLRRSTPDVEADVSVLSHVLGPAEMIQGDVAENASLVVAVAAGESNATATQQQGAPVAVDPAAPLAANERRARAAALRALALSRERRFDAARAAFAEAARLDPALDLTRTPTFWKLERAAHEAAIDAYLQAGRERDAAVLRARVQSTFRPKPLRPRPQVILSP